MTSTWPDRRAKLERSFRHFAEMCSGRSPLYAALAPRIAEDEPILRLLEERQRGQPAVNLLFGAVHDLLLAGAEHPLAAWYPSTGGRRVPDADLYPAFVDFCRAQAEPIREMAATRRVQTNEPARCGLLLPALALAHRTWPQPLFLIELGCSLGLCLQPERYRYRYAVDDVEHGCGPASPACIRVDVRDSPGFRPPAHLPPIGGAVGIDLDPQDLHDDAAVRWVEAMIWADQVERLELFRTAVAIARVRPPRVVPGDGLEVVPALVDAVPDGHVPCVMHSHAIYQMTDPWRAAFAERLAALGQDRPLARVSLEWLIEDPRPQLRLELHDEAGVRPLHLADVHTHGTWMRWCG